MSFKKALLVLALVMIASVGQAQEVKIGYTNIELVLAYMPEAKQMEQQLDTYQKNLGRQLQVKQDYMQQKYQGYLQEKEAGTISPSQQKELEAELLKLDAEVQKFAQESEEKLLAKREELLTPILEKLQNAIDETAEEQKYTYILNQTTSSGVSTILYGPDQDDLTEAIMKKLGITLPQE